MKKINFYKMAGTGNHFIVIDNRDKKIKNLKKFTKKYCEYAYGVGADGVIAVEESKKYDFKMRIINSDGSEAEMCGNGARCVTLFAYETGIVKSTKMAFDTLAGPIKGEIKTKDIVKVQMIDPFGLRVNQKLKYKNRIIKYDFINTGVPHTVIFSSNLEKEDVFNKGRFIRNHNAFAPAGTNVNFVQIKSNIVYVRTYERGVEDETLACGTGSTASALICALHKKLKSPVGLITAGREKLKVYFEKNQNDFKNVFLEGKVLTPFRGEILI